MSLDGVFTTGYLRVGWQMPGSAVRLRIAPGPHCAKRPGSRDKIGIRSLSRLWFTSGTRLQIGVNPVSKDAVSSIENRVRRILGGARVSESLSPAATADIRNLRSTPGWDRDLRARMALGWLHWFRYEALPAGQDAEEEEAALTALLPCFLADRGPMPEELLPDLAGAAFAEAASMLEQAATLPDTGPVLAVAGLYRRILAATPPDAPANRAMALGMLGMALQILFERTGDLADLDQAVEAGRQAADEMPAGHRGQLAVLINLAVALRMRYDRTGAASGRQDIDEAIAVLQRAATLTAAADSAAVLVNLGGSLRARYDRYGDPADLEVAIDTARQALAAIPDYHPERPRLMGNLGVALAARFTLLGDSADLTESIGLLGQAMNRMPERSADRSLTASNLAASLWLRFEVNGTDSDLDRAIDMLRLALADPPANFAERARLFSNLSLGLWGRFQRFGTAADLDAAIDAGRRAIAALPAGDVNLALFHSNLSLALRVRFEQSAQPQDIETAVEAARASVANTTPGHLDRARRLTNLGNALREKATSTGADQDLTKAIEALSEAAGIFPPDHPDRAKALSGLGNALRTLSEQSGAPRDADQAITVLREALSAAPDDSADRSLHLFNLGKALQARLNITSAAADQADALAYLTEAASTGTAQPYLQAQAARSAALLAAGSQVHQAALLAQTAVHLLPEIAPRRISRGDQQRRLSDFAGLASEAAALALLDSRDDHDAERALGLLEAGRGVLLSQALNTRDDLTELATGHSELAARYVRLRDQLDHPQQELPETPGGSSHAALRLERKAGDRYRLAADFAATVTEIRALPEFTRFMLPPDLPDLLRQAGQSTVIAINVSRYGSDALVLSQRTVTSLPLPGLTLRSIASQTGVLNRLLGQADDPEELTYTPAEATEALSGLLEWLWDTVAGPVLDYLGHTQVPGPGHDVPRIWWMPGGLLSLLPLHAAGYHRERGGRTVLDRVISSYTPTIRALGRAREHARARSGPPQRSLIVAMPTTPGPGIPALRHAAREASRLNQILPAPALLIEDRAVSEHTPTKDAVLAALADADIAHFACHATSDPAEPSHNMLILHDHDTNPLTISSLAPVQLDRVQLAYLSACQTSRSASEGLTDESIHLSSAFQLAGYPHVIGTLWQIVDSFAADIADEFYSQLQKGPRPFVTDAAAETLRDVIRSKRDRYPNRPLLWAAHIHAGA